MAHTSINKPSIQTHTRARNRRPRGFSLIELMVVVAILAILSAIAVNSYTRYIQRSRRTDAYAALAQDQGIMERCYALTFDYENVSEGENNCVEIATTSQEGYYTIALASVTTTAYTLTATPVSGSPQAEDTSCAQISITNANIKTAYDASGTEDSTTCWQQ
jgi:type IV pilus assembly protein PilE